MQAAEADEEQAPASPAAGATRKPLLTTHDPPVSPFQKYKRGKDARSHKLPSETQHLHTPGARPAFVPGSPGGSLSTHLQSLQSSKTPFAAVSPHSPASIVAPNPPSRRKGHMDVIENRITDLVDQVSQLHRDVSHTEQHRYERALNLAEREADVLAHR